MGSIPLKNTSAMAILAEQRAALSSDISGRSSTSANRRPLKSSTYEDNFNFAFSFYQPMIDYLDKKESGGGSDVRRKEPLPRLRFLEEQSLQKKKSNDALLDNSSSSRGSGGVGGSKSMVRSYTERDMRALIESAEREQQNHQHHHHQDEVSGGGRLQRKTYKGRSVTFTDDGGLDKGTMMMSTQVPAFSSLNMSQSSEPSGVKLGVSKSTLSTKSSGGAPSSNNSNNNRATTPAREYSLTKQSIKAGLLSNSVVVNEVSSKLAESKRRLEEEKERESRLSRSSILYRDMKELDGQQERDHHHMRSKEFISLQRSHSFGAFTKKAKKDVEEKIAFNAVVQRISSGGGGSSSTGPLARSISDVSTSISVAPSTTSTAPTSINDLHSPVNLPKRRKSSCRCCYAKNVSFSKTGTDAVRKNELVDLTSDEMGNFSGGAPPIPQFKLNFDENNGDVEYWKDLCKQMTIEIEQMSARLVEAETKLKTEVTRIKKKLQVQITELEMSLDVANKNNIELQKTVKKYSIQLTELQSHYDEVQRQLQVALDQYGQAQRRATALQGELDEVRNSLEASLRAKRAVEQSLEETQSRVNELTTINVNLASQRTKLEQELSIISSDYDEVSKELKLSDERYQKVSVELTRTIDILHEEQERVVKIESIKKSLEIEVKNLSVRLEEVEANALVNGKRIISKLEGRLRDLEMELDEEKRRHNETIKILRKKERHVKEIMVSIEEQNQQIALLQEALDKVGHKANLYKRQLQEQESLAATNITRVRRFQRELEAAEDRADSAESNLSLIRAKHRSFVTSSVTPGTGQVFVVQETKTTESSY